MSHGKALFYRSTLGWGYTANIGTGLCIVTHTGHTHTRVHWVSCSPRNVLSGTLWTSTASLACWVAGGYGDWLPHTAQAAHSVSSKAHEVHYRNTSTSSQHTANHRKVIAAMIQTPVSFTQEGLPCFGFAGRGGRVSRRFVISLKEKMLLKKKEEEGNRRRVLKFRCACQQNVEAKSCSESHT